MTCCYCEPVMLLKQTNTSSSHHPRSLCSRSLLLLVPSSRCTSNLVCAPSIVKRNVDKSEKPPAKRVHGLQAKAVRSALSITILCGERYSQKRSQPWLTIAGKDPCNPNPCQNGGTCSYLQDPKTSFTTILRGEQNTPVSAVCTCQSPRFTGTFCTVP